MIQAVLLINNQILISQVYELDVEPGTPNCKLVDPYLYNLDDNGKYKLIPWLNDITGESTFMLEPSKIITIFDPSSEILEKYKKIIILENDLDDDILEDNVEEIES